MKKPASFLLGLIVANLALSMEAAETVRWVNKPDSALENRHYKGNRAPLVPSPLIRLPIGSIRPHGWIRRMLELQAEGFHGHLMEISDFLNKTDNAWLDREGKGGRGWEEPPYWLKGFQDCMFLLGDEKGIHEARVWIEAALRSQVEDGWFGPGEERTGVATNLKGREDLWPNMIMLFCLQSYFDQTQDDRVMDLMERYYRYLARIPEDKFLPGYWPKMRAGDLIYSIHWYYNRGGGGWVLGLADKVHRQAARWDTGVINWHNVNIAQGFREPAIYFSQSLNPDDLKASERNWNRVRELYGQVPGGMFGSDENCRPGYTGPRQAVETCGMVEEMLSDEIMIGLTGDSRWADRCEDVAFNSLPASMTADLKALRYLTAPNQPVSDHTSKSPGIQNSGPMYHMNPHDHRCCQHNSGHGWPYYAQHLWYAAPGNGIAALMYGHNTLEAKVGDGGLVTIREETRYPFEDRVNFNIQTADPVDFPFYLRIPGWAQTTTVKLNDRIVWSGDQTEGFVVLDRTWSDGDRVELIMPSSIRIKEWQAIPGTVSIYKGPLAYSLKITENYVGQGGTDTWPAWDILPGSAWNMAIPEEILDDENAWSFQKQNWPADNQPWTSDGTPVSIHTKGKSIPEWGLDGNGLIMEIQECPVRTVSPIESIQMIPMGAARLRISVFPLAGKDGTGQVWKSYQRAEAN